VNNIKAKSGEILDKINQDIKADEALKATSQKLTIDEETE